MESSPLNTVWPDRMPFVNSIIIYKELQVQMLFMFKEIGGGVDQPI
jgi:hypothetical protein